MDQKSIDAQWSAREAEWLADYNSRLKTYENDMETLRGTPFMPRKSGAPGIHWTRTGGKTHRVEIVR